MTASSFKGLWIALFFVLLATLPLWISDGYYVNIASQILIWAVAAMGLNLIVGYAGLVSLGHAALFAISGYAVGIAMSAGFGHLAAALLGIGISILTAAIFGALSLRSTGIGFLMITLAIGQILWGIAYRWVSLTNGDNGVSIGSVVDRVDCRWQIIRNDFVFDCFDANLSRKRRDQQLIAFKNFAGS